MGLPLWQMKFILLLLDMEYHQSLIDGNWSVARKLAVLIIEILIEMLSHMHTRWLEGFFFPFEER